MMIHSKEFLGYFETSSNNTFESVSSFWLNSTSKMDFNEHRAASIIVEFDDARAEKLKKKSNFYNTDFL